MEQNKGRGAGVWILLMILLLLWNMGALAVGGVLRILAGLRGSEKTTSEKPGVSMTDAVQTGEVSVRFDEAVHWTVSSDFASEGFTYAQIWVTLENTGSGAIESPDPACFFVEYDGEVPGWMHDWQSVYGNEYLRQTFGADNRANIMGEITENTAYYDADYYDEPRTLAPGESVNVYRLYQVPEGTEHVTGVKVSQVDDNLKPIPGTEMHFDCDTLLLSVGLIPENELSRTGGIALSPVTRGPAVNQFRQTSNPAVFACGNVLHVNDLVDHVSRESAEAGRNAALFAAGALPSGAAHPTVAGCGIRYVCPQSVVADGGGDVTLYFRTVVPGRRTVFRCTSGGGELAARKCARTSPGTMESLTIPREKAATIAGPVEVCCEHGEVLA